MKRPIYIFLTLLFLFFTPTALAVSKSDFPNAKQATINTISISNNNVSVLASLDSFALYTQPYQDGDCFNDVSEYHELYNASTGELVLASPHTDTFGYGYAQCVNRTTGDSAGIVFPPYVLPSGTYWMHYVGANNTIEWVSDNFTFNPPTPTSHAPAAVIGTSLSNDGVLQLDGSLSSDPDNKPLTYVWHIGNETQSRSGQIITLDNLAAGTYPITLTVNDGTMQTSAASKIGIPQKLAKATVGMDIDTININKTTGDFLIKGSLEGSQTLFKSIPTTPRARITLEIENGKNAQVPLYGIVGIDTLKLSTMGKILK